jgi:hypothetical protein
MWKMLKPKTITTYIFTYAMWIVSFLLWLWVMYLGRNLLTDVLNPMVMPGAVQQAKMVQLADRVYLMTMGLIWLVLMIVVENYFRRGVERGEIWRRIGRVLGPQILLVFAVDLAMVFFYGPDGQPVSRWVNSS